MFQILILGCLTTVGSEAFNTVSGNVDHNDMSYTLQIKVDEMNSYISEGTINDENTMTGEIYGIGAYVANN